MSLLSLILLIAAGVPMGFTFGYYLGKRER